MFGPPSRVTETSPWRCLDHLASGLISATESPCSDSLSLRLRSMRTLTLQRSLTRRTILQKVRGQPTTQTTLARRPNGIGLPPVVGIWFQVLFHSPLGVLFTFPSRYLFTIGRQRIFSLGKWSSRIPTGFLVPRGTWDCHPGSHRLFAYRTITVYGRPFQTASAKPMVSYSPTGP